MSLNPGPNGEPARSHPLYVRWRSMKDRCRNPNNKNYHRYGGRGITICDRWFDFWTFVEDVSALPYYGEPERSLDRWPNPDGNYEVTNVRWATRKEQAETADYSNVRPPYLTGSKKPASKLTDQDVRVIRVILSLGFNLSETARMFDVDRSVVSRIASGKAWTHVV